ncbi:Na+/H+ antiporter subunit E, partial [Streptomyces sp. TRM76130]|nr:Na+/H+ antiporter subunit E [Streptomyces sp. TRM76130]
VARLTTMTPGTVVIEIDRRRKRLYVHALPVRDQRDIERRRDGVRAVERRVARAAGHRHDAGRPGPAAGRPDDTRRHSGGREP